MNIGSGMFQTIARHVYPTVLTCAILLGVSACSGIPDPAARLDLAQSVAPGGFHSRTIATDEFDLFALLPSGFAAAPDHTLTVFIEGDGFSYVSKTQPSVDPTPVKQTVISLLPADGRPDVAYLARPCQFASPAPRHCDKTLWTTGRYSERVIDAMGQALSLLVAEAHATHVKLIGYSGGGVVAALLAARRNDVVALVTIAAPLDVAAFVAYHHASPMRGSLNPRDEAARLGHVAQIHYAGGEDKTVPPVILDSYMNALANQNCARLIVVDEATHSTGWEVLLPALYNVVPRCVVARP